MEYKTIKFEVIDSVAVITLNRPKSLNAVTSGMLSEIKSIINEIEAEDKIRVLILTGEENFFAAGFDIKEISTIEQPKDANDLKVHLDNCYSRLASMKIPTIAATSGMTFGGGFELALACDFRIASSNAKFGLPEINLGLIPGAGGTQRLPRLIGMGRAYEMLYTGVPVTAAKALEMGLVNDVVEPENLLEQALKKAKQIAQKSGFSLKILKDVVQTGMEMNLESALEYEGRCFEMLFSTHDQKEGVNAFIEKRRPEFRDC